MKNLYKFSLLMILIIIGQTAFADVKSATVDGYCYLEGVDDHGGTLVLFEAISPSAQSDSTYTNSDGSYLKGLSEGIYTIHYSNSTWLPYTIPGEILISTSITLEDVVLHSGMILEVSGSVNGVWTPEYKYHVVGNILVPNSQTLTIEPGVTVVFQDYYEMKVYGTLIAEGTLADSIIFTSGYIIQKPGDWQRITFENCPLGNSVISYAKIEFSKDGVECNDAYLEMANSTIRRTSRYGIYCLNNSSPNIKNNTLTYCGYNAHPNSGIFCAENSSPIIDNNRIDNSYVGIWCTYSSFPTIIQNIIIDNEATGVYCNYSSHPSIIGNIIRNNSSGVNCYEASAYIFGNYLSDNGYGVHFSDANPVIQNNTICFNSYGIKCFNTTGFTVLNNIFYENHIGLNILSIPTLFNFNLYWDNETNIIGNIPNAFGQIITNNTNGDPCDTYFNLFMDPEFIDPENYNFQISENSPCIDAGNPDPAYIDPDGTIAEIGASYYDQVGIGLYPFSSHVISVYPNPSNGIIEISIEGEAEEFQVKVIDLHAKTRRIDIIEKTSYTTTKQLDLKELPAGIYFICFFNKEFNQVKKIVIQ